MLSIIRLFVYIYNFIFSNFGQTPNFLEYEEEIYRLDDDINDDQQSTLFNDHGIFMFFHLYLTHLGYYVALLPSSFFCVYYGFYQYWRFLNSQCLIDSPFCFLLNKWFISFFNYEFLFSEFQEPWFVFVFNLFYFFKTIINFIFNFFGFLILGDCSIFFFCVSLFVGVQCLRLVVSKNLRIFFIFVSGFNLLFWLFFTLFLFFVFLPVLMNGSFFDFFGQYFLFFQRASWSSSIKINNVMLFFFFFFTIYIYLTIFVASWFYSIFPGLCIKLNFTFLVQKFSFLKIPQLFCKLKVMQFPHIVFKPFVIKPFFLRFFLSPTENKKRKFNQNSTVLIQLPFQIPLFLSFSDGFIFLKSFIRVKYPIFLKFSFQNSSGKDSILFPLIPLSFIGKVVELPKLTYAKITSFVSGYFINLTSYVKRISCIFFLLDFFFLFFFLLFIYCFSLIGSLIKVSFFLYRVYIQNLGIRIHQAETVVSLNDEEYLFFEWLNHPDVPQEYIVENLSQEDIVFFELDGSKWETEGNSFGENPFFLIPSEDEDLVPNDLLRLYKQNIKLGTAAEKGESISESPTEDLMLDFFFDVFRGFSKFELYNIKEIVSFEGKFFKSEKIFDEMDSLFFFNDFISFSDIILLYQYYFAKFLVWWTEFSDILFKHYIDAFFLCYFCFFFFFPLVLFFFCSLSLLYSQDNWLQQFYYYLFRPVVKEYPVDKVKSFSSNAENEKLLRLMPTTKTQLDLDFLNYQKLKIKKKG